MFKPGICMFSKAAFTLLELLIVVVIIAILAAVAVPHYNSNSTRAKMSELIPVLDNLVHKVMIQYNAKGIMPASLENVSGAGPTGGYGPFVIPDLTTHLHYDNGSSWANTGALVQISIPYDLGKSIPGYVESTDGADGAYNSLAMAFYEEDGIIKIYCGSWDASTLYIPPEFLPGGCRDVDLQTIVTGN